MTSLNILYVTKTQILKTTQFFKAYLVLEKYSSFVS